MMTKQEISEADCWFVIGAHQAGATERECSNLSGLPKSTTHNIIKNFKKLGSPHSSVLSMASILDAGPKKRKAANISGNSSPKSEKITVQQSRKRGRPRKYTDEGFSTALLVRDVLLSSRSEPVTQTSLDTLPQNSCQRPDSPPMSDSNDSNRGSMLGEDEAECLPPTPRSLPLEDESDEDMCTTEEGWSIEDDEKLLNHVLGLPILSKWKEVEPEFGDRHRADMCGERWDILKKRLLSDVSRFVNELDTLATKS
ncbi:Homeodomain-like DNA binding domain-containing transcription factor [Phycomyces blakesleeanus]|uniref:Homeodomain-like DNA binding domain-containing transcription factor n=1 Tax=Phycomyces blakesleeanus TaxID=4837 RepID=A0ABR3B2E4_PHYBL